MMAVGWIIGSTTVAYEGISSKIGRQFKPVRHATLALTVKKCGNSEFSCHQQVLFGYLYGDMIINTMMAEDKTTDTDLVTQSLDGDRDAFGQIVSRYQSLICSLAYSATGNLGQSQDLAQET